MKKPRLNIVFLAIGFLLPRRYYRFDDHVTGFDTFSVMSMYFIGGIFVLAQLLFLINIILAIIKSIKFNAHH